MFNSIKRIIASNEYNILSYFIVIGLFWSILYLWRPWFLGFYHDDWTILVEPVLKTKAWSWDRFYFLFVNHETRMFSAILYWISSSINEASAEKWQIFNAITSLLTSCVIGATAYRLAAIHQEFNEEKIKISFFSAILWLIFPWNVGITISPLLSVFQFAVIFFCVGIHFFLNGLKNSFFYFFSFLSFTLVHLIYEAFFFQFLVLPLFFYVFISKHSYKKILLILGASQVVITILLKIIGTPKQFNTAFIKLFIKNICALPKILLSTSLNFSLNNNFNINKISSIFLFVLTLLGLYYYVYRKFSHHFSAFIWICFMGVSVSILTFSIAGYSLNGLGYFSRTLIGVSFWLCFIGAFLLSKASKKLVAGFFILLVCSSLFRSMDWIRSYQIQNKILGSIETLDFSGLKSKSAIVIQKIPCSINGVEIFGASWDINSAFQSRYSQLREKEIVVLGEGCFVTKWEAPWLTQHFTLDSKALWRFEVSDVTWVSFIN